MKTIMFLGLSLGLSLMPSAMNAQPNGHAAHVSPYSGLELRPIKSLSQADMDELRRGGGWGLALAAELNGMPGPAHLLELKDQIPLTADQIAVIEAIFGEMKAEAMATGEKLIASEQAVEDAFRSGNLTSEQLRHLIDDAESARAELRFIHLSRHLLTPSLLTNTQIARYKALRGYGDDPCLNVPEGHDPAMWRLHNGCN